MTPDEIDGRLWLAGVGGTQLAAHVTRASAGPPTQPPLVYVHGGPGVADMAHDVPVLAGLATVRDVWVYDQIGAGASDRLADPSGYTMRRAVSDLEAVADAATATSGHDDVVLLGHSWGAGVASVFAAEQPDRVAALVLSAPGQSPLGAAPAVSGDPTAGLSTRDTLRLYAELAKPRNTFVYALTAAAPDVAHVAAGDHEMDRRFAAVYDLTTAAMFCDPGLQDRLGVQGAGYYANQMPQLHDRSPITVLNRQAIDELPVLVLRPECDYLTREMTTSNIQVFPQARFVVLPRAGHAAHHERPDSYRRVVASFLNSALH
ncbi:alpha/beta fold hydrolase [Jannaschia sp. R86511]|uniref:alpha/beta fold hydrolase n=1 Tax=Jannaschia sp. R86511 TaxID=3093853 RepID=UPI0036D425AB